MYLQELLEVVIGLIFTWLVISTATMQVQEWLADLSRARARDLEGAVRRMLNDGDLTRLFYDHPLIRSLSGAGGNTPSAWPSYIPANKFSTVLLNVISSAETESSLLLHRLYGLSGRVAGIKSGAMRKAAEDGLRRMTELARLSIGTEGGKAMGNLILASLEKEIKGFGREFPEMDDPVQAILDTVHKDKEQIDKLLKSLPDAKEKPSDLSRVLRGMLALSVTNPELTLTLNGLLMGMEQDGAADGPGAFQKLQANVESWFNDSMDRLSGWYKRRAQFSAFLIGLALAVLLNIDTIQISNQLWREPAVRQAINSNLDQILQNSGGAAAAGSTDFIVSLQDQFLSLGLPLGWTFETAQTAGPQACAFVPGPGSVFGLSGKDGCIRPTGTQASTNGWFWLLTKAGGLLITGVASAQGSSFWFDVLVKIVNIRSAGKKPE
jgi:hypothetical protein